MRNQSLHVSMETLIAASPMLGHELEDRGSIRDAQDLALANYLLSETETPLRGRNQRDSFCVAPLDILVAEHDGRKQFHLLELNGTGIGGVSNLPYEPLKAILASVTESTAAVEDPEGVVLLAVSGKESESAPRLNRLMHEKLLFLEAMGRGLALQFGESKVRNLQQLEAESGRGGQAQPTAVMGYIKDLMHALELDSDGALWMHGRRVTGALNDRFCRNVLAHFDEQVDLSHLHTMNRCFAAGADKGVAYSLMNDFIRRQHYPGLPAEVKTAHAACRLSLIETVLDWLADGRQVVIKPHGTGLGHGIEFFLDRREPIDAIVARIDRSLQQTEEYYGMPGGALPYTVCEYVDACRVESPGHPLNGHKYELRVVVYRDGQQLRAFPSIAKVARERCGDGPCDRRALINNITASGDTLKVCGTDYMLPLCNPRTLAMLGLTTEELSELCRISTGYVRYVLDEVQDSPRRFGLPTAAPVLASFPTFAPQPVAA